MKRFPVGTRVQVISGGYGATGADGEEGVIAHSAMRPSSGSVREGGPKVVLNRTHEVWQLHPTDAVLKPLDKINMLVKYIRDKKRRPIGAVVALQEGVKVKFGFSLVHKVDRKKRGVLSKASLRNVAIARALKHNSSSKWHMPRSFHKEFETMQDRAVRYFKGASL